MAVLLCLLVLAPMLLIFPWPAELSQVKTERKTLHLRICFANSTPPLLIFFLAEKELDDRKKCLQKLSDGLHNLSNLQSSTVYTIDFFVIFIRAATCSPAASW